MSCVVLHTVVVGVVCVAVGGWVDSGGGRGAVGVAVEGVVRSVGAGTGVVWWCGSSRRRREVVTARSGMLYRGGGDRPCKWKSPCRWKNPFEWIRRYVWESGVAVEETAPWLNQRSPGVHRACWLRLRRGKYQTNSPGGSPGGKKGARGTTGDGGEHAASRRVVRRVDPVGGRLRGGSCGR